MGPRRCNIEGCKSVAGRTQHRGVTFHTFPTNETIRHNWMTNCRFPSTKSITKSVLICSRHFRRVDFQPLKNNKYLLKPGSEPTIFPWTQSASASAQAAAAASSAANVQASTSSNSSTAEASSSNENRPATLAETVGGEIDAKPMTPEERIVNQILSDAIKSDMKSPMKRSASADVGPGEIAPASEPKTKQLRKSLDSAMFKKTAASAAAAMAANSTDPDSLFRPGAEIEAQDYKEVWHPAEVIEVDQVDREVFIHFDTANIEYKVSDEWIPMNSSRLRARQMSASPVVSSASAPPTVTIVVDDTSPPPLPDAQEAILVVVPPAAAAPVAQAVTASAPMQPSTPLPGNLPVLKKAPYNYVVGEKIMAKWTDSRRWRATVQTVLDLDYYDILFDDGYSKRCHAKDMSKIKRQPPQHGSTGPPPTFTTTTTQQLLPPPPPQVIASPAVVASPVATTSATPASGTKPSTGGGRKINPPLPIPKFDLASLNLLPVPKDGEWCCNWVNDTPIGAEGYLEGPDGNRRPTVLVEDWRLPGGWTKHLYQRSSVSGKWDVVLVGPTKKRFRSKNDVKVFLDEHGLQYNPDVYDFSIHKRRAKDLGLFVFTEDYKEAQHLKQQQLLQRLADQKHTATSSQSSFDALNQSNVSNISTEEVFQGFPAPVTPMSSPHQAASAAGSSITFHSFAAPSMTVAQSSAASNSGIGTTTAFGAAIDKPPSPLDEGYVFVGSLKVQMHDNLFRCPEPTCNKNFRKENHLQIHVKHYHDHLAKQMGECLNMAELAYIRTTGELPPPEESVSVAQSHKPSAEVGLGGVQEASDAGGALTVAGIIGDDVHDDFQLDGNRTSTPVKPGVAGSSALNELGGVPPSATTGAQRQTHKKYKKGAKNVKSRLKLKLQKQHGNRYTKSGRSVRPQTSSLSERYTDYDLNDDGEYQDSDYVPEGSTGSAAGPSTANTSASPAVRSNRLKFLNHPQVLADAVAAGADPNAALLQSPLPPQTDVYVDENGEVIKLVRMRQEEIINCMCLYSEEDGLMIQCELCLTWQHGRCHGFEKASAVPDKYVCYICQNPQSGRPSMRFVHDQEWLYEGRLPVTEQQPQQRPAVHDGDASGNATMEVVLPKHRERFDMLKHSHTLTGNLLELKRFMHSLQVKINIAENKDHPKMYLWARKWEKSSPQSSRHGTANHTDVLSGIVPLMASQNSGDAKHHVVKLEGGGGGDASVPTIEEVQVINDLMSNADAMKHIERAAAEIAKTEIKNEEQTDGEASKQVKQEDEVDGNILAGLLTSPGGTNIDLVGAVEKQEQHGVAGGNRRSVGGGNGMRTPMSAPQPEAAIDPVECQLRLLDHIQKQQMQAMTRLQSIEAEVIGLEAMDEHAEPVDANDSFGSTKRQIFQLISDLTKIRKLAAINLAEDDELQLKMKVASASTLPQASIG